MYQISRNSKITLNHHGEIPPYANNCRLYETTGVGSLLITDWKPDLKEMFEPGKEVIAYQNNDECAELIQYYLDHEDERKAIARAGVGVDNSLDDVTDCRCFVEHGHDDR